MILKYCEDCAAILPCVLMNENRKVVSAHEEMCYWDGLAQSLLNSAVSGHSLASIELPSMR